MSEVISELCWGSVLRAWGDAGEAPPAAIVASVLHDLADQSAEEGGVERFPDPDAVTIGPEGRARMEPPLTLGGLVELMELSLDGVEPGRTGDLMPPQARSGLERFRDAVHEASEDELAFEVERFQGWLRETFGPLPAPDEVLRCCRASHPLDPQAATLLPSRVEGLPARDRVAPREWMSEPPRASGRSPSGFGPAAGPFSPGPAEDGEAPSHFESLFEPAVPSSPAQPGDFGPFGSAAPAAEVPPEASEPPATEIQPASGASEDALPTPEAASEGPAEADDGPADGTPEERGLLSEGPSLSDWAISDPPNPSAYAAAGTEIDRLGREGGIRLDDAGSSDGWPAVDASGERPVVRRELPRPERPVSVHRAPAARRSARPRSEQGDSILIPADGAGLRSWVIVLLGIGVAVGLYVFLSP